MATGFNPPKDTVKTTTSTNPIVDTTACFNSPKGKVKLDFWDQVIANDLKFQFP